LGELLRQQAGFVTSVASFRDDPKGRARNP
jgi:hypothetical protein